MSQESRPHRYTLDAAGKVVLHEKNRFRAMPRDEKQRWHKIVTYVPDGG